MILFVRFFFFIVLLCFFLGFFECVKLGNLYFMDFIDKYLNVLMCKLVNKCLLLNGVFLKICVILKIIE